MGPKSTIGYGLFLLSVISIALGACGGGGGSGGNSAPGGGGGNGSNSAPGGGAASSLALFAGDMQGSGSDDGVGPVARFNAPQGVATDSAGNVYVSDTSNSIIRKITPEGVVSTLAGAAGMPGSSDSTDGTGATARFNFPRSLGTDRAGNVYVAETFTIRKITPTGMVTTLAGTAGVRGFSDGTGPAASFSAPYGGAADSAGNIYVVDSAHCTIRKITTPEGVVTTVGGVHRGPHGCSGAGGEVNGPFGVATDSADNVYASHPNGQVISKLGLGTVFAGMVDIIGSSDATGAAASFNRPLGVATDSAGNVYVADTGNHTIRKITPSGEVSTVVGVAGQAGFAPGPLPGLLSNPLGVAVSGTSLYILLNNGVAVVRNLP